MRADKISEIKVQESGSLNNGSIPFSKIVQRNRIIIFQSITKIIITRFVVYFLKGNLTVFV